MRKGLVRIIGAVVTVGALFGLLGGSTAQANITKCATEAGYILCLGTAGSNGDSQTVVLVSKNGRATGALVQCNPTSKGGAYQVAIFANGRNVLVTSPRVVPHSSCVHG